jgi:hypothetical protein
VCRVACGEKTWKAYFSSNQIACGHSILNRLSGNSISGQKDDEKKHLKPLN